jgi:phage-related protein
MISRPGTRPLLRRVAQALLIYGVFGLAVSLAATIAVGLALGRLSSVGEGAGAGADQLGTALGRMATVLDDASASASSFGSTIDSSSAALTTAAADLRAIVPQLREIETQANAINILGSRPLAPLASLFGDIARQLGDLDGQLEGVSTGLAANRGALTANATSLAGLATEIRALRDRVPDDLSGASFDEARWLAIVLLLVVLAAVALPAVAALWLGWWLRRELLGSAGFTLA